MSDRGLNKRMETLFPKRKRVTFSCEHCVWERTYRDGSAVYSAFELARSGCPECGEDLNEPEYEEFTGGCRVCGEEAVDGRWNYCSERCRDIATAVQSMFTWSKVREAVLSRDLYTCNECAHCEPPGSRDGTLQVDHIQRIADGGHPFDERNLQTLCKDCHEEKTAEENSDETRADITLEDYL